MPFLTKKEKILVKKYCELNPNHDDLYIRVKILKEKSFKLALKEALTRDCEINDKIKATY